MNNKIQEIKQQAIEKLFDHLGFDGMDGTYIYLLTRVKEAFHVGTMTLDDFVEVDGEFVGELADVFVEIATPLLSEYDRLTDEQKALIRSLDETNKKSDEMLIVLQKYRQALKEAREELECESPNAALFLINVALEDGDKE